MKNQRDYNEDVERREQAAMLNSLNTDFDLGLFLYILRKNFVMVLLLIGFLFLLGVLYLRYTAPIFQTTTEVQFEKNNQANQLLEVSDYYDGNDISSEIEILKSPVLMEAVINNLPLEVSYYAKGQFLKEETYKSAPYTVKIIEKDSTIETTYITVDFTSENSGELIWDSKDEKRMSFKTGELIELPFAKLIIKVKDYDKIEKENNSIKGKETLFAINNTQSLVREFLGQLEILILNVNAKTLQISFKDRNRLKSYEILEQLIHEFRLFTVQKKRRSSKQILNFLDDQIEIVYNKQKQNELEIQQFKRDNDITDVEQFAVVYTERLNRMDEAQAELELKVSALKEMKNRIADEEGEIDMYAFLPLLIVNDYDRSLAQVVDNLNEILLNRQKKLYGLKETSSPIDEFNYQIDIQKKIIFESIGILLGKYEFQLKELQGRFEEVQMKFLGQPEAEIEFLRLKRLYDINEKFYTMLVQKKTEYSISQEGYVSDLNVLKTPKIANTPISPNRTIVFVGFLLAGIFISFSYLIIKYLLHNKITTISEIRKFAQSNIKVLGVVPEYTTALLSNQLVINKNLKSMISESFRAIRSNLEFLSSQKGSKVLVVTSTVSGEGKTFIAINLGSIIAHSGKKVIIVDLDLRRPKIHKSFDAQNRIGISTALIGKNTIEECINHSSQENLDFITAGPIPPNPSELILSEKMDQIIEELKKEYDLIIIDTPPVGIVTDGIEMIRKADYPIYIFRAEYSRRNFINNLDALINDSNINKLSIVLNSVGKRERSYKYSGYNGYGYGYGYNTNYYHSDYYTDDEESHKRPFWNRLRRK